MKRRVALAWFSALAVAILMVTNGTVAGASEGASPASRGQSEPGPAPAGLSDRSPVDDVIPPVAERIFEMGMSRGFAGQRTDYKNRAITVFWKGTAPKDVKDYIDSRPFGVAISLVEGAKYSRAEGNAARDRLWNSSLAGDLKIVSISVNGDGSGLVVGSMQTTSPSDVEASELKSVAGIDEIQVNLGRSEIKGYASRMNDASPWKGGGRAVHGGSGGQGCTTGFAVLVGSYGRLLGARHCDTSANLVVYDGNLDTIAPGGTSVAGIGSIDSLLIDPTASPATTPKIYVGSYTSSTLATVKNWYSNWPGDPVCSSGATTGSHCGTVYDDNDTELVNGYVVGVIQAKAPSGSIMSGQGDSGGPVYKSVTGGVQARGIILGGDPDYAQTTSCGAHDLHMGQTILCSRYMDYIPISTILNTWGVALEVG